MPEFRVHCPQCGRQIQCHAGYAGKQINCPACHQPIVAPQMDYSGNAAAQPPVAAQMRTRRIIPVITGSVIVFGALLIASWFGYSEIKRGHLPPGLVALW